MKTWIEAVVVTSGVGAGTAASVIEVETDFRYITGSRVSDAGGEDGGGGRDH